MGSPKRRNKMGDVLKIGSSLVRDCRCFLHPEEERREKCKVDIGTVNFLIRPSFTTKCGCGGKEVTYVVSMELGYGFYCLPCIKKMETSVFVGSTEAEIWKICENMRTPSTIKPARK